VASSAVALLISMLTTGTAQAATTSRALPVVHFQNSATVRGGGAGAVVTLSISCPGLKETVFEISAQQNRPDGTVVNASGYAQLNNCNRTAQTLRVPLCTGCVGENSSFPGTGAPLHPGKAAGIAFLYDDTVNPQIDYYYPPQPIALIDSARLDHPSDGATAFQPQARLVAGGAAADLFIAAACHAGVPSLPPLNGELTLYQATSSSFVQNASPFLQPTGPCHGPATYRIRVCPNLNVYPPPAPALRARTAFVISGPLWGQVTIR
jgi:hypothetical protein